MNSDIQDIKTKLSISNILVNDSNGENDISNETNANTVTTERHPNNNYQVNTFKCGTTYEFFVPNLTKTTSETKASSNSSKATPVTSPSGMLSKFRVRQQLTESEGKHLHENSCTRCRKLKRKCDRGHPSCLNCSKLKYECVYLPRKKRAKLGKHSEHSQSDNNRDLHQYNQAFNKLEKIDNGKHSVMETSTTNSAPNSITLISLFNLDDNESDEPVNFSSRCYRPELIEIMLNEFFINTIDVIPCVQRDFIKGLKLHDLDSFPDQFELNFILLTGYLYGVRNGKLKDDGSVKYFKWKALNSCNDITEISLRNVRRQLLIIQYALVKPANIWGVIGKTIQDVYYLGLHKKLPADDEDHYYNEDSNSKFDAIFERNPEVRNRIFWSVYIIDRRVSSFLGRPYGIHSDDIELDPPKYEEDYLKSQSQLTYDVLQEKLWVLMYVWCSVVADVRKRLYSQSLCNNSTDEEKYQAIDELSGKIEVWYSWYLRLIENFFPKFDESGNLLHQHISKREALLNKIGCCYNYSLTLIYGPSAAFPDPKGENRKKVLSGCLALFEKVEKVASADNFPFTLVNMHCLLISSATLVYLIQKHEIPLKIALHNFKLCYKVFEYFSPYSQVCNWSSNLFKTLIEISSDTKNINLIKFNSLLSLFARGVKNYQQHKLDFFEKLVSD